MRLSVPSRFEMELLEKFGRFNKKYGSIDKIYGSLPSSIIGHGRIAGLVKKFGDFDMDHVREFTEEAHRIGIRVNYLANTLCLGEVGYTNDGREKILSYLGEVYETGADIITVASPYIHRLVKTEYPGLKTEISVYAEIDTVQKFKRWEELGADIINLPSRANRDFELLESIAKSRKTEVELLVNESCLFHCPYSLYHHTVSSHRSRIPDDGVDYCMLECVQDRLEDPSELLKAAWIRPEDIAYYEKTYGIDRYKIQGRQMPVKWIENTVEAYSTRKHSGNLLDLISPTYPDWSARSAANQQTLPGFQPQDLKRPDVYIDNSQLDRFFTTLVKKGGCAPTKPCDTCRYCNQASKNLVQIRNQEQFKTYAAATKALFEHAITASTA